MCNLISFCLLFIVNKTHQQIVGKSIGRKTQNESFDETGRNIFLARLTKSTKPLLDRQTSGV